MVDPIDYVKKLVGVDHVGIGSNPRGMSKYTAAGFGEEARFDAITEGGYSAGEIGKVMAENFVRVWREVTR